MAMIRFAMSEIHPANMENSGHIILFGSGRLAFQVGRRLRDRKIPVTHIGSEHFNVAGKSLEESIVEYFRGTLRKANLDAARAVYVLDEEDRYNIQFALIVASLNETVPVLAALFNAELAGHLQSVRPEVVVRNPALAASSALVDCLRAPVTRKIRHRPIPPEAAARSWWSEVHGNSWLYTLASIFLGLLISGTVLFHFTEKLRWIDALYFTVTVMTTTGFGDISLRDSSIAAKLFGIGLMLSAVILASLLFSFIADRLFKKRSEVALGRKRYRLKDHVIVCGLGRTGYQVVKELLRRKEKVLVIEKDPDSRFLEIVRGLGAKVFVGDASIPRVLTDAGVRQACALFSLINDDLHNLEIGLNARALRPDLRLILRIFDREIADLLRDMLDIHFAMSTSAIAADEFVTLLQPAPETKSPKAITAQNQV